LTLVFGLSAPPVGRGICHEVDTSPLFHYSNLTLFHSSMGEAAFYG
jgi:hypothetical protein